MTDTTILFIGLGVFWLTLLVGTLRNLERLPWCYRSNPTNFDANIRNCWECDWFENCNADNPNICQCRDENDKPRLKCDECPR